VDRHSVILNLRAEIGRGVALIQNKVGAFLADFLLDGIVIAPERNPYIHQIMDTRLYIGNGFRHRIDTGYGSTEIDTQPPQSNYNLPAFALLHRCSHSERG
jgi:hypothetical protein